MSIAFQGSSAEHSAMRYDGIGVEGLLRLYPKQRAMEQLEIQRVIGERLAERIMDGRQSVRGILRDFRELAPTPLERAGVRKPASADESAPVQLAIFDGETHEPSQAESRDGIFVSHGLARVATYMRTIKTLMMKVYGFTYEDYLHYRDGHHNAMDGLMKEKVDPTSADEMGRLKAPSIPVHEDFADMLEADIEWFAKG